MIPVNQKYIHIEGQQAGDCWRACIASILECEIEDFPILENYDDWSDYYPKVLKVLDAKGWQLVGYTIENINNPDILQANDTDGYVIAVGKSPRSTPEKRINHAVVWKNGIVHDPHPDNTGLIEIIIFEILIKKIVESTCNDTK